MVALRRTVAALLLLDGSARLVALGVALAAVGLAWGSLRMDALRESVLAAELGESGVAELVTVAPARPSPWSTRVIAMTRDVPARAGARARPARAAGRSLAAARDHPGGDRPRRRAAPEQDGFDERGWLARQGIHVVLEGVELAADRATRRDCRPR